MPSRKRLVIETIAITFLSIITIALFTSGTLSQLQQNDYAIFVAIAAGQLTGLGLLGTAYLNMIYDDPFSRIKFNFKKEHILIIIGVTILVLLFNATSQAISTAANIETAQNNIQPYLQNQQNVILFSIISLVIVGPLEEYFYRGILQERLKEGFKPIYAIILTSVLFSVTHIGSMTGTDPSGFILYLITLFLGAMVLGYSYERTENLAIPILAHGLYNGLLALTLLA